MEQLTLDFKESEFPRVKYLPKDGEVFVGHYNKALKPGSDPLPYGFDVYKTDTRFYFIPFNGSEGRLENITSHKKFRSEFGFTLPPRSLDRCCSILCTQCYAENYIWRVQQGIEND